MLSSIRRNSSSKAQRPVNPFGPPPSSDSLISAAGAGSGTLPAWPGLSGTGDGDRYVQRSTMLQITSQPYRSILL